MYSTDDLLLWNRCRRQFKHGNGPSDIAIYNLREQKRVLSIGLAWKKPHYTIDNSDQATAVEETLSAVSQERSVGRALLKTGEITVPVDYIEYSSKRGTWEVSLFRAATGVRGIYFLEASLILLAAEENGLEISDIHVLFLNKEYRRDGSLDTAMLFRESNVTKRASKKVPMVRGLRDDFINLVDTPISEEYRCGNNCSLCIPEINEDKYSIHTLHKGGNIASRLAAQGITDLREIPSDIRLTRKQIVQIRAVRTGRIAIDCKALGSFLTSIHYPRWFLDFEAFSQSTPPFKGLKPFEHTPSLVSIHQIASEGADLQHYAFSLHTAQDRRNEFYSWIKEVLGTEGSIVVFSRNFESSMLKQLSAADGEGKGLTPLLDRIVDLLEPFQRFDIYHPDQRGKVSLKRLLPVFGSSLYDEGPVSDGMEANLSFLRRFDRNIETVDGIEGSSAKSAEDICRNDPAIPEPRRIEEIITYCTLDTLAMVVILQELEKLYAQRCLVE